MFAKVHVPGLQRVGEPRIVLRARWVELNQRPVEVPVDLLNQPAHRPGSAPVRLGTCSITRSSASTMTPATAALKATNAALLNDRRTVGHDAALLDGLMPPTM